MFFPYINIPKVLREELKTKGTAKGLQCFPSDLANKLNNKIMLDRYLCINSTKPFHKLRKCMGTLCIASTQASSNILTLALFYMYTSGFKLAQNFREK